MPKYFKTCLNSQNETTIVPVKTPHPFEHKGIELFSHKEGDEWRVSERTTGLIVSEHGKTQEAVIKEVTVLIDKLGVEFVKEKIKASYEKNKIEIDKYNGVVTKKLLVIQ